MKHKILIVLLLFIIIVSCSKDNSISTDNKYLNRQVVGSSAHNLLSGKTFNSIIIELAYNEGFKPNQTTINNFVSFIEKRTNKPNGITLDIKVIPSSGNNTYSIDEISNIEKQHRTHYNTSNQIAIWAYFTDGKSDKDSSVNNTVVLGAAYWNTSFVIYEKTIQGLSSSPFQPKRSVLETTVINHEFGHILGLTNIGTPIQSDHQDASHPKHCKIKSCLMYWAAETNVLSNSSSTAQLGAQCLADLKANGGK